MKTKIIHKNNSAQEFDIEIVLEELKKSSIIYTSEMELQFDLIRIIKQVYSNAIVRCEFGDVLKMKNQQGIYENKFVHIDVLVFYNNMIYPIEIKFRKRPLRVSKEECGLEIVYKNQGAPDAAIYNYINDICRVEKFVEKHRDRCIKGYTIFLTNQKKYTDMSYKERTIFTDCDTVFRFNKIVIPKKGNIQVDGKNRRYELERGYEIEWVPYTIQDEEFYLAYNEVKV